MKFQKTLLASAITGLLVSGTSQAGNFDDAGTDYTDAKQHAHVWTPGIESLKTVNSILCFVEQLQTGEMVNQGLYTALVDEKKCNTNNGNDRDKGPSQQFVIVETVREDDTSPQKAKIWIPGMRMGDNMKGTIKAYASMSKEPTTADPLQDFTLHFDMYLQNGLKVGGGQIQATPSSELENGKIGIRFYEEQMDGQGGQRISAANIIKNPDGSDGVAITRSPNREGSDPRYIGLSWNETTVQDRVKIKRGNSANNNSDLTGEEICLAKDELKTAVWQYGVYYKNDGTGYTAGQEVEVNSGFPIRYGQNGEQHGYVGYWGIWTEDNQTPTGTIYKENYQNDTQQMVTLSTAPGKLWQNSLKQVTTDQINGIGFEYGDWDSVANEWKQYKIEYDKDAATPGFYKVATLVYTKQGPQETALNTPILLDLNNVGDRLFLWSNQLGGQVTIGINEGLISKIMVAERTLVNPNSSLFNNTDTDVTLKCFDRCPKGNIGLNDVQGNGSPYQTYNASGYDYTINRTNMTLQTSGSNVAFNNVTQQQLDQSNYQWGVQSGILLPSSAASGVSKQDLYDGTVTTWYEWETGLQNWNQYTLVKVDGQTVTFDEPLKFQLNFDAATMARQNAGQSAKFDGQTFFLEYGGNGNLWGFPSIPVGDDKFYPAVAVKDGTTISRSGTDYVVKAWEMEQKMATKTDGSCNGLMLGDVPGGLPTGIDTTLTANTDDVPAKSELPDSPSVVNGVVQVTTD